jgi:hypothetical protein
VNATFSPVARIAGVAIVLILAAALGLIAGNALNARVDVGAGADASLPHMGGFDGARYDSSQRDGATVSGPGPFPNVWGNVADDGAAPEAPAYADPYRRHIEGAASDPAVVGPQTWGNIDERHDARSSDESSVGESLTAPTPR